MWKVAISAVVGIAAAGAVIGLAYSGAHLTPLMMMTVAAALSVGAAAAILTRTIVDKNAGKTPKEALLSAQLREVGQLIARFPHGGGVLELSVKPDTLFDKFDIFDNPGKYTSHEIVVTLRAVKNLKFNPVELKRLFGKLKDQPGFIHLILLDTSGEFVGYIPGFIAKREFTGANAEVQLAKFVNDVFADDNNSINLRQIEGAGKSDVISDEAKVSDAIVKMAGGFRRLIVLRHGYHRRPIGIVNFSDLMNETLGSKPMLKSLLGG